MNPDITRAPTWLPAFKDIATETPLSVRVRGGCMAPLVHDGAQVQIGGPASRYWPGDVVAVLVADQGRLALHRVIGGYWRRGQWQYLTQGDRVPRPDMAVTSNQILGRVHAGECSPLLVRVPVRHRLRALGHFLYFILIRLMRGLRP